MPRYEQTMFPDAEKRGWLRLVGSSDGRNGLAVIHQHVELLAAIVNEVEQATHLLGTWRKGWIQFVRGATEANGRRRDAGDGAAVQHEAAISVKGQVDVTEILVFDLPYPDCMSTTSINHP